MDTNGGIRRRSRIPESFHIRPARIGEVDDVLGLIDRAADWLRSQKETSQWNEPWPTLEKRDARVRQGVLDRDTWLLFDESRPIGTVTIKQTGDAQLWEPGERAIRAVYLHRLVVDRELKGLGLGAELIHWASRKGAALRPGAGVVRLDVWSDNDELHAYYKRLGFSHVATRSTRDDTPSGALFEREVTGLWTVATGRIVEAREPAVKITAPSRAAAVPTTTTRPGRLG